MSGDGMALNQQALEAACAAAWGANHWPRVPNAEQERHYHGLAVAAYLDALAEQGIRLVDVREYADGGQPTLSACPCGRVPDPGIRPEGGCWCAQDGEIAPRALVSADIVDALVGVVPCVDVRVTELILALRKACRDADSPVVPTPVAEAIAALTAYADAVPPLKQRLAEAERAVEKARVGERAKVVREVAEWLRSTTRYATAEDFLTRFGSRHESRDGTDALPCGSCDCAPNECAYHDGYGW